MKQVTAIGLIFVLSLQCFYKLGVLTYFQVNRDFIAEVLCINKEEPIRQCNGQCFLKKNLDAANETTPTDGATAPSKLSVEFPVFVVSEFQFAPFNFGNPQKPLSSHLCTTSPGHISAPFHPPASQA